MFTPSEPMAEVEVSEPARTPTTVCSTGGRSAPRLSLCSTLPVTVPPSTTEALSGLACGTSSTMFTSRLPVALLPSVSMATTLKLSPMLLMPWPAG